jgi:nucleotide-binding universal stress UspA family protein
MSRPQSIIAATDFSAGAQRAVEQAARLAKAWHAALSVIHVFNDSTWAKIKAIYDLSHWASSDPVAAARQKLDAIRADLARDHGVNADTGVLTGCASKKIHEFVAARQDGLLVVGEHGENWLRDAVLGGTALKVLEAAQTPVLLVRQPAAGAYQRIVIATDFSETASRAARLAIALFPEARHHLVHAYAVPFEARMRMGGAQEEDIQHYRDQEYLKAAQNLEAFAVDCDYHAAAEFTRLALYGYPASVLFEQAEGMEADLIVIGKHGGGAFEEKLLGSVTQNVLYHAGCDVLLSP